MPTLLSITNNVLRRLREDTVTDLTDSYVALVASFVADIAQEVNEATIWNALDHEVVVSVVASTSTYALAATTAKSMLLWTPEGMPQAWIFNDVNDRYGFPLWYLDPSEFQDRFQSDRSNTNSKPNFFTVEKNSTNDSLQIKLWPVPNATNYIRIRFNTPEAELDPTTDAAVVVKVPNRVVRLGALYMALNERGEEMGEPGGVAEQRYHMALGAAVEEELRARERSGVYDWVRN